MLGDTYDADGDSVELLFECLTACANDIQFDKDSKSIIIRENTPAGVYRLKVTLSDDSPVDPKSKDYLFSIMIKETIIEEKIIEDVEEHKVNPFDDKEESKPSGELPTFSITELSSVGELTVSFSQNMRLV